MSLTAGPSTTGLATLKPIFLPSRGQRAGWPAASWGRLAGWPASLASRSAGQPAGRVQLAGRASQSGWPSWLASQLAGWPGGRLASWLAGWLAGWPTGWSRSWLAGWPVDWLAENRDLLGKIFNPFTQLELQLPSHTMVRFQCAE